MPTCKLQVLLLQARLIIMRGAQLSAEGLSCYDCPHACPNPLSYQPDANVIPLLETHDVSLTLVGHKAEINSNESLVAIERGMPPCVGVELPMYCFQLCKVEFRYSSPVCQLLTHLLSSHHLNVIRNSLVFCVSIKCHMFVLQLFVSLHEQN